MILREYDADDLDDDDPIDDPDVPDDDETSDDCPGCGAEIYDDSERCHRCGRYLSREDTPRRHPRWVMAGSAACLAMVAWWIFHP